MNRYQKELLARLLIVPIGIISVIVLIKLGLLKKVLLTIGIVTFTLFAALMFCLFFHSIYLMIKTRWVMRKIVESEEDYKLYKLYLKYSEGDSKLYGYRFFIYELNPDEKQKKKLDEFKKIDDEINGRNVEDEDC